MTTRRKIIRSLAVGVPAAAMLGAGWVAYAIRSARHPHLQTLDEVRGWLDAATPRSLVSSGSWSPGQILAHCAQSLEYSLEGFPQPKSGLFQATVGSAALGVFGALGAMKHDLGEPVPGSVMEDLETEAEAGATRLLAALDAFEGTSEPLRPHFAYGELSRDQFAHAHAMHISEHLGQLG